MSLPTPPVSVEKLQQSLHAKAKSEPGYRFYSLWDKVFRNDVLEHAYRSCRANGGAAGVDGKSFDDIESEGRAAWLVNLQQELRGGQYAPLPLRRKWIPKANGGQRPLGIPAIRDRVVQAAVLFTLEPIFEADLPQEQYGFRRGRDAKSAIRRVFFQITKDRRTEVVDGDLHDYFSTIPHGALMKCVARRVSDQRILKLIKAWLSVPVVERTLHGERRTTEARDARRGTPQGGVISPLLSNLYFRRFVLAWRKLEHRQPLGAAVTNYADDFVVCCRPGSGSAAMKRTRELMTRLGLTVNEEKTRLVRIPAESFDFLGYTFCRRYTHAGRPYFGTRPSRKAVRKVVRRIHEETSRRWTSSTAEKRVLEVNRVVRGWCGYFDQGPVGDEYHLLTRYIAWRFRRWLKEKHRLKTRGSRRFTYAYLFDTLGLVKPTALLRDQAKAKA